MNEKQARKLKVGDRLKWADGVKGTVTKILTHGVEAEWDDRQRGGLDFKDMIACEKVYEGNCHRESRLKS